MPDITTISSLGTKPFQSHVDTAGRVCTVCGVYKAWSEFSNDKTKQTGKRADCKVCSTESEKARPKRRPDNKVLLKKKHLLRATNPYLWKSRQIRGSLIRRSDNEDFKKATPTREQIEEWLVYNTPFKCAYSDVDLTIYNIVIDHKIPISRGGDNSFNNLCVCSNSMNTIKGAMTYIEFAALLDLVSTWEDKGTRLFTRLKQGYFFGNK